MNAIRQPGCRAVWLLLAALGTASTLLGQAPTGPLPPRPGVPVQQAPKGQIKVQVAMVTTPVTVRDSRGVMVHDLDAKNFQVTDNGMAQKISAKALQGLAKNEKIGPRGRWWLEEHAKYDDEHPIQALEIIKDCVRRGESAPSVTEAAKMSLVLMKDAMVAAYAA